jgi:hypothetical protein
VDPARTNLFVWKDLDHLKSYYADAVNAETIDNIAKEIRDEDKSFVQRKYNKGESLNDHLNERCFCNLVEIKIIDRSNKAFNQFLEKPIYNRVIE